MQWDQLHNWDLGAQEADEFNNKDSQHTMLRNL